MGEIDLFKECFKNLTIEELHNRIEFFKNFVAGRETSETIVRNEIRKVFTTKISGKEVFFFLNNDVLTNKFEKFTFYRVRKFCPEDYRGLQDTKFTSLKSEQDAWWPPSQYVSKYGRINRPNEPVFYLSNNLSNAIYETRCRPGECFFVMVYTNLKPMRVAQLHDSKYMKELSELENAKRILMLNFLVQMFIKSVPEGKENEYMSSLILYEEFFKHNNMDAFVYPSISSPLKIGYNIAFPVGKAKENLSFQGLMILELVGKGKDSEFENKSYYDGFYENEHGFSFYPFNSCFSREKFGHFSRIRDMGL